MIFVRRRQHQQVTTGRGTSHGSSTSSTSGHYNKSLVSNTSSSSLLAPSVLVAKAAGVGLPSNKKVSPISSRKSPVRIKMAKQRKNRSSFSTSLEHSTLSTMVLPMNFTKQRLEEESYPLSLPPFGNNIEPNHTPQQQHPAMGNLSKVWPVSSSASAAALALEKINATHPHLSNNHNTTNSSSHGSSKNNRRGLNIVIQAECMRRLQVEKECLLNETVGNEEKYNEDASPLPATTTTTTTTTTAAPQEIDLVAAVMAAAMAAGPNLSQRAQREASSSSSNGGVVIPVTPKFWEERKSTDEEDDDDGEVSDDDNDDEEEDEDEDNDNRSKGKKNRSSSTQSTSSMSSSSQWGSSMSSNSSVASNASSSSSKSEGASPRSRSSNSSHLRMKIPNRPMMMNNNNNTNNNTNGSVPAPPSSTPRMVGRRTRPTPAAAAAAAANRDYKKSFSAMGDFSRARLDLEDYLPSKLRVEHCQQEAHNVQRREDIKELTMAIGMTKARLVEALQIADSLKLRVDQLGKENQTLQQRMEEIMIVQ